MVFISQQQVMGVNNNIKPDPLQLGILSEGNQGVEGKEEERRGVY